MTLDLTPLDSWRQQRPEDRWYMVIGSDAYKVILYCDCGEPTATRAELSDAAAAAIEMCECGGGDFLGTAE